MVVNKEIEKKFKNILSKAIEYLKSIGTNEIILFGSLAEGNYNEFSDIDLAISGISPRIYFKAVATLPLLVGKKIDLVLVDFVSKDFKTKIRKEGQTVYAK